MHRLIDSNKATAVLPRRREAITSRKSLTTDLYRWPFFVRLLSAAVLCTAAAPLSSAFAGVSTAVYLADVGYGQGADLVVRGYNPDQATDYIAYVGESGFQIGNGGGSPTHPVDDSGLQNCTVFTCSANSFGSVVTSGTTDKSGALTSAFDQLSGSGAEGPAAATVSANLADGTLHATGSGSFGYVYGGEDQYSSGAAVGAINDGLHFTIAGATSTTVTPIQLAFQIDGLETTTNTEKYGYQSGNTTYVLALGGTVLGASSRWMPGSSEIPVPIYTNEQTNPGSGDLTIANVVTISDTPEATDLVVTYDLTGATVDAGFSEVFGVGCQDGVSCDFKDTAKVSLILPTNVTYTSDSGVFLTAPAGGVPEPATWAMLLAGFTGAGAALRRRSALARNGLA